MSTMAEFRPPAGSLADSGEFEFPLETPIAEMTDGQAAEYWRHEAKKQQRRFRAALSQIRQTIDEVSHA